MSSSARLRITPTAALRTAGASICALALAGSLVACGLNKDKASHDGGVNPSAVKTLEPEASDTATTPTPEEKPVSSVAPAPQAGEATVNQEFVADSFERSMVVLEQPAENIDLTQVLTGAALEARDNERQELESNKLRQEGKPKVLHSEIVPGDSPNKVSARICVDNSDVKLFDENNVLVNGNVPAEEQRSAMLASFEKVDGMWKMSDLQFPDDPRC